VLLAGLGLEKAKWVTAVGLAGLLPIIEFLPCTGAWDPVSRLGASKSNAGKRNDRTMEGFLIHQRFDETRLAEWRGSRRRASKCRRGAEP
jgi:hypothetical protein